VEGTRVEGAVLIVQARLNINLTAMNIEQVVFKRKKLVLDMCASLQLETQNVLSGTDENLISQLLKDQGILPAQVSLREYCMDEFKKMKETDPEVFNNDAQFREKINHTLSIKEFAFPSAQLDAEKIKAFGKAGKAAGALIGLIGKRLEDPTDSVRTVAAEVLAQIAEKGDSGVVEALLGRIDGEHVNVRQRVAKALGQVALKGDQQVIQALLGLIGHEDLYVRASAAKALGQVAATGDLQVIQALLGRIDDEHWAVRQGVAKALGQVALNGDQQVIQVLLNKLGAASWSSRSGAAMGLGAVAKKGDRQVVEALLGRIDDEHASVRQRVAEALGQVALKGDQQVIQALLGRINDEDSDVRQAVAEALGQVALKGDPQVIQALGSMNVCNRFGDHDAEVRDEALRKLASA